MVAILSRPQFVNAVVSKCSAINMHKQHRIFLSFLGYLYFRIDFDSPDDDFQVLKSTEVLGHSESETVQLIVGESTQIRWNDIGLWTLLLIWINFNPNMDK